MLRSRFGRLVRMFGGDTTSAGDPAPCEGSKRDQRNISPLDLETPNSWSTDYPDVPAPDAKLTVQMFVARWTCGKIPAEKMPLIAADLLECGYDSPGLRRLAAEIAAATTAADCNDLMVRVLSDFGIPSPFPWKRACLLVTRQIARETIGGLHDPLSAIWQIEGVWNWDLALAGGEIALLRRYAEDWFWDESRQEMRDPGPRDVLNAFAAIGKLTDEELLGTDG